MKEQEIRPEVLFKKYLELSKADAETYFSNVIKKDVPCCGCGSIEKRFEFTKFGFNIVSCKECDSLFVSPRPDIIEFEKFYKDSPSIEYWTKIFFPAVAEIRREKLFRPKAIQIAELCEAEDFKPKIIADIGAGYGILLEELKNQFGDSELIAVEPNPNMVKICQDKGFIVEPNFVEMADSIIEEVDLAISLEVIEHVYDPLEFCKSVYNLLTKCGRALFTTLTISGFDMQILWEKSKSIFPPHHINFLSVNGLYNLMERTGFSNVRIFTPGKLDIDIVKNSLHELSLDTKEYRFIKKIIDSDDNTIDAFQAFLANHQLSSHCWIWVEK